MGVDVMYIARQKSRWIYRISRCLQVLSCHHVFLFYLKFIFILILFFNVLFFNYDEFCLEFNSIFRLPQKLRLNCEVT